MSKRKKVRVPWFQIIPGWRPRESLRTRRYRQAIESGFSKREAEFWRECDWRIDTKHHKEVLRSRYKDTKEYAEYYDLLDPSEELTKEDWKLYWKGIPKKTEDKKDYLEIKKRVDSWMKAAFEIDVQLGYLTMQMIWKDQGGET